MEYSDAQLIQRTLSGDQDAFAALVCKYQKRVHALAWRKIGDFHIAEEITQDTFLRAYRKLGSLKDPKLLAGWLYVIANRLCKTWLSKNARQVQSLEDVTELEIERHQYSDYSAKQREELASENRVDLVKRLLRKLPESERIVMTLHYLAGSSVKEISEFLGVSLNTVKSRLHRARQRLQKEEHMLRETLGNFQPSTTLTDNIIRTIKDTGTQLDPTGPSGGKPFVPWVIATSTLILVMMMFGFGSQHLARFQKPYSLDAMSEMSVDIVDTSVMKNLPTDPDVQNQIGHVNGVDNSEASQQQPDTKSSSVTGSVVDEAGNPVEDVDIAILPVEYGSGRWWPIPIDEDSDLDNPIAFHAESNSDGNFVIPAFDHGTVLLAALPLHGPVTEIIEVNLHGISFYTSGNFGRGIVFDSNPGNDIRNIKVTVQHFLQVQGKVLQFDGTALSNERIDLW